MGESSYDQGAITIEDDIVSVEVYGGAVRTFPVSAISRIFLTNSDLVTIDRIDWEIELSSGEPVWLSEDFAGYQEFSTWLGGKIELDWEAMIEHQINAFSDARTLFFERRG